MVLKERYIAPSVIKNDDYEISSLSDNQVTRVVLVDIHKLVRLALQRSVMAFPAMDVIALSTIHDALLVIDKQAVHAFVLGPSVSISDCLQFMKLLDEKHASSGIVVIQQCLHPETAITLVKKGVHSLLDESASEQDLAQAIAAASLGNTFLSRRAHGLLTLSMSRAPIHLTEREMQVLSLLRHGESNFRIAYALGLKEKTVEKYLTNIYEKLHVNSRAETILYIQRFHI